MKIAEPVSEDQHPIWPQQFQREWDFHEKDTSLYYMISSTPRSGSHFLSHVLRRAGCFGYPLEYLNPSNLRRWKEILGENNDAEAFRRIKRIRTSGNGVFGVKLHYSHLATMHDVEDKVYDYKIIHLRRRDKLKQAISFARASQTGSWISGMTAIREARYQWDLIHNKLNAICLDEAGWQSYFLSVGAHPLTIYYEDVVEDPSEGVRRCASFLSLDLLEEVGNDGPSFLPTVQSEASDDQWVRRYLSEAPSRINSALRGHPIREPLVEGRRKGGLQKLMKRLVGKGQ